MKKMEDLWSSASKEVKILIDNFVENVPEDNELILLNYQQLAMFNLMKLDSNEIDSGEIAKPISIISSTFHYETKPIEMHNNDNLINHRQHSVITKLTQQLQYA
ncbi:hypothetical protein [Leptospira licerasiae]|uniref:hypothetical protein n=1 Tax=Leptospira licerasiae TaxID=447106 RepID=UPI0030186029